VGIKRPIGSALIRLISTGVVTLLLALLGAAVAQELSLKEIGPLISVAPNNIASIPPVAEAVLTGNPKYVTQALEKYGIDEPVRAKEGARAGFTPLILATALSNLDIVAQLVTRGANAGIRDDFNRSAFWYAAELHNIQITKVLTDAKGANDVINAADTELKQTPLHIAVRDDDPDLVVILKQMGASPDKKDVLGETPLDYCSHDKNAACARLY
jgi:ankyrin repeat protein